MIVVIDGPAGSGKSTTAIEVADRCGIEYIDSGALYRACSILYLKFDNEQGQTFPDFLKSFNINFKYVERIFRVFIDHHEVTDLLRKSEVSECVSSVAAMPEVRLFVNKLMKQASEERSIIADGRDLGTNVFPDADFKFFMVADLDTRAKRRYKELRHMHKSITLDEVKENIKRRDLTDSTRTASPLKKADDAIEIDTTFLSLDEQVQFICNKIEPII